MVVCLHCGELAPDGALFCTKCGFTLPQVDPRAAGVPAPAGPPASAAPSTPPAPAAVSPGYAYGGRPPMVPYALAIPAGAVPAVPPPPGAKYCVRCRTIISAAAVYCPVCQQPQA